MHLSDDLDHDTCFTQKLQRIVLLSIKENLPQIKSIHYFSGGCAGQCKNYKAFLNLCHHKSVFNNDVTWAFFATNYGKSPCNRIVGTVKSKILCLFAETFYNQILMFHAVEEYCKSKGEITFLTIDKGDMVALRENLKPWYELGDTVPGIRNCHHFVPTSQYNEGKQVFITHSFLDMPAPQNETLESLECNDYITCCFYGVWWLALIEVVNKGETDLRCKFLHPHGQSGQFH